MLLAAITIALSLTSPDPRLEAFQLSDMSPEMWQAIKDAEKIVQDVDEYIKNEPTIWWRMTGWGVYLACGSIPASNVYRQDRSTWEPNGPNNSALSAAIFAPSALTANVLSEKARDGRKSDAAWAARLSMLGACVWTSGWNFNQGWKRR